MKTDRRATPQSRRGWIVVATTSVTMALFYGIWYSYGVFFVALLREFGWTRSIVAGAFSIFVLVHGTSGTFVGALAGRSGPRRVILIGGLTLALGLFLTAETTQWWHLYVSFAGIAALGIGLGGFVPSVVLVREWFPSKVATTVGIASAGIGVGISVVAPLSQFLIERIGWRWTYRVLAMAVTAWIIPSTIWLLKNPPASIAGDRADVRAHEDIPPVGGPHWTLAAAGRTWRFWGLALAFMTGNVVPQMLFVHQVAYLVDQGVAALAAAAVGGIAGLVSIPGKFAWGILSDRTGRELTYSLGFGCIGVSIGLLVLAGAYPGSGLLYLYAVVMGLGYAVTAPVMPAISSDVFGGPGFSAIFGSLHMALCLGTAVGSWGGGKIFDVTGSYTVAFWLALGLAVFSPALLWVVGPRHPNPPHAHGRPRVNCQP